MKKLNIKLKKLFKKLEKEFVSFKKDMTFKKAVILGAIIIVSIPFIFGTFTLARYVISTVHENYLLSKEFYFYSTVLDEIAPSYNLYDWDGASNYTISVDIENYIDELRWTSEDLNYQVTVNCSPNISGNVICSSNNNGVGTINYVSTGGTKNEVNITLNPNSLNFTSNDYVDMSIEISAISPYSKTIRGNFRIYVGERTITYKIKDSAGSKYLDFVLSNNTTSTKSISLAWNYADFTVDSANSYIIAGTPRTITINGIKYVNGSTFNIEGDSSIMIRFFKTDPSVNNTYPITTSTSVIELTEN